MDKIRVIEKLHSELRDKFYELSKYCFNEEITLSYSGGKIVFYFYK